MLRGPSRWLVLAASIVGVAAPLAAQQASPPDPALAALIERALDVSLPTRSASEYAAASERYREVLVQARALDSSGLSLDDQVDLELLLAHVRTEIFEIDTLRLHTLHPVSYLNLSAADRLFLWPGAIDPSEGPPVPDPLVRAAIRGLLRLPALLRSGTENLTEPARTWTENTIYQVGYARLLLTEMVPRYRIASPVLRDSLTAAGGEALAALDRFESFLREDLLPRSTRSPSWTPHAVEVYQLVHEQLDEYGVDAMLRVAEEEDREIWTAMEALADSIHSSGDLRTVWELMKDEAPPWQGVLPMAQRYVDMATEWLQGKGSHVVEIPAFNYGARITSPMARRTLSFGGASGGHRIDGRPSGYYVLTPVEDQLSDAERASRLRSYNPYWTHVISYHEWIGHNVEGANTELRVDRPMRRAFGSIYMSQAWSFYLEQLLEDEGYYDDMLEYTSRLKTRMARLQMRMWRVQRILTKLRMAKGEMTFNESVQAYVDRIGMEPANAFIEVQRDSQTPSPPGREIIGERIILEMRDAYRNAVGEEAFTLRGFHQSLLGYGRIPLPQIRQLMLRDAQRGVS
jgi:uncharacterized protein (DUF885 family)